MYYIMPRATLIQSEDEKISMVVCLISVYCDRI